MRRSAATALVAMLALLGCNPVADQSPPAPASESASPSPEPASESAQPSAPPSDEAVPTELPSDVLKPQPPKSTEGAERTVTGTLTGDPQLEGGCVWIDTPDGAIEPLLPEGYMTTMNPVALLGPDGETVAEGGDQVTITGRPATEILTICQVGAVWHVSAIEAAGG